MSGDHNMHQKPFKRVEQAKGKKRMKDYLAGEAVWRTAEDQTPPLGVKMLLLNAGGVCVIGTWDDWAVAWAPLPKVPAHIKQILLEKSTWLWV